VPVTTLVLARHGETDWNREQRFQGHADPPLNDLGRAQAVALADELAESAARFDVVYTSDLRRAYETARIVAERLGVPLEVARGLREIDVGSWSGLTRDEIAERFPGGYGRWLEGEQGHDGETREALQRRVVGAVREIAARHAGGTLLLVTHGGSLRALLSHAAGKPSTRRFENCAVCRVEIEDGKVREVD
jgi:probable phosphoglycerate mutase